MTDFYQTLCISRALSVISYTQEVLRLKPDWLLVKRLLLSKYLKSNLNITS